MKSSTLKDVAQQLHLSISTISRVVNNKGYVKPETRERVMQCLRESNYVPNEIARSLKMKATMTIGVIVPDICEVFLSRIIKGINRVVSPAGYMLFVADSNERKHLERKYLDIMFQKRVDALVIATVDLEHPNVDQFLSNGIPVIFIDNLPVLSSSDLHCVLMDNRRASCMAVQALLDAGHRRIAAIVGPEEETTGSERLKGYEETLTDNCLPVVPELIARGNFKEDDGYRCMNELLANQELAPFTAVYVTSEMMTIGALRALREHRLKVGRDISLMGFDIHDDLGLAIPKIATVRQPEDEIGAKAGTMLLQLLDPEKYGEPEETRIFLDGYLEPGNSIRRLTGNPDA